MTKYNKSTQAYYTYCDFDQDTVASFSLPFPTPLFLTYSAITEHLLYLRLCFRRWKHKTNASLCHCQWNPNCITTIKIILFLWIIIKEGPYVCE